MADVREDIRQKIAIELENARLWGTFIIPLSALLFALFLTEQYFVNYAVARYLVGLMDLFSILFVILMRTECLRRARNYIKDL